MSDAPHLGIEIVSLFPEIFDSFLGASLLGKAIAAGLVSVDRSNPRDFAAGRHRQVDDAPYGGGPGMILRPEPVMAAIEAAEAARGPTHRVLLTPRGRRFDQQAATALAAHPRLLLLCGRYEGVDERIAAACHESLCIGDYVLSGGEIAACVVIEAVTRLLPGVLGSGASVLDESFAHGRLEYPQWTRPAEWRGQGVPPLLLSGDHAAVEAWRRRESLRTTAARRPDLFAVRPLDEAERRLLDEDPENR